MTFTKNTRCIHVGRRRAQARSPKSPTPFRPESKRILNFVLNRTVINPLQNQGFRGPNRLRVGRSLHYLLIEAVDTKPSTQTSSVVAESSCTSPTTLQPISSLELLMPFERLVPCRYSALVIRINTTENKIHHFGKEVIIHHLIMGPDKLEATKAWWKLSPSRRCPSG